MEDGSEPHERELVGARGTGHEREKEEREREKRANEDKATQRTLYSSSISESPGQSGRRLIISAKMVPMPHMSTGHAYCRWPRRISGARYHRVTTS